VTYRSTEASAHYTCCSSTTNIDCRARPHAAPRRRGAALSIIKLARRSGRAGHDQWSGAARRPEEPNPGRGQPAGRKCAACGARAGGVQPADTASADPARTCGGRVPAAEADAGSPWRAFKSLRDRARRAQFAYAGAPSVIRIDAGLVEDMTRSGRAPDCLRASPPMFESRVLDSLFARASLVPY